MKHSIRIGKEFSRSMFYPGEIDIDGKTYEFTLGVSHDHNTGSMKVVVWTDDVPEKQTYYEQQITKHFDL